MEWAQQLLLKSAVALSGLKQVLNASEVLPLDQALAFEQENFIKLVGTDLARQGMQKTQQAYDRGETIAQVNHYHQQVIDD